MIFDYDYASLLNQIFGYKSNSKVLSLKRIEVSRDKNTSVVIFNDGEKIIFKRKKGDKFDIEKVWMMAVLMKQEGVSKTQMKKVLVNMERNFVNYHGTK